jgi:hypothetical protein
MADEHGYDARLSVCSSSSTARARARAPPDMSKAYTPGPEGYID